MTDFFYVLNMSSLKSCIIIFWLRIGFVTHSEPPKYSVILFLIFVLIFLWNTFIFFWGFYNEITQPSLIFLTSLTFDQANIYMSFPLDMQNKYEYEILKPKIMLLFLEFFIKSCILILAFLKMNWQKYGCLQKISWFSFLVFCFLVFWLSNG